MNDILTWAGNYGPAAFITILVLASALWVIRQAVEKSIAAGFARRQEEWTLLLGRRSGFMDRVLTDRYTLVTGLTARLKKVQTNLNRTRRGNPVAEGFRVEGEIIPFTEIYEDLAIHRMILGETYHTQFQELAALTYQLAELTYLPCEPADQPARDAAWEALCGQMLAVEAALRATATADFHLTASALDDPSDDRPARPRPR